MLKSSACRSALYLAVLAANTGLMTTYAPHAIAAQGLEEVVVTARKREESVQEVPIAVSAFSAEQLKDAGVSNIADLANQVPGMQMDQGGISQIWIRGVGQRSNYSYIDSPTGVYLDGIYISRKEGQMLDLMDMESVQVLRGPQGTLFGKNTTAGALVMSTRKPTNEFSGAFDARIGNYYRQDARLIVNMPIIEDKLLSKISIGQVKRDGYMTNILDGQKAADENRQAANLQLRWLPTDTVTVDTFFYAAKTRESPPAVQTSLLHGSGYKGANPFYETLMWPGDTKSVWAVQNVYNMKMGYFPPDLTGDPRYDGKPAYDAESKTYAAAHNNAEAATRGGYKFISNQVGTNDVDNYMLGVTVEWEISDKLSFKSITGYGDQRVMPGFGYTDGDGTDQIFAQYAPQKSSPRSQVSQEFQFTGDAFDDRFHYSTGLFGMLEKIDDNNTFTGALNGLVVPAEMGGALMGTPSDPNNPQMQPQGMGILTPSTSYRDTYKLENTTLAAYFQGSYDITPNLQVTGGLRWTSEKRSDEFTHQSVDGQAFAKQLCYENPAAHGDFKFTKDKLINDGPGEECDRFDADGAQLINMVAGFGSFVAPVRLPTGEDGDVSIMKDLQEIQDMYPLGPDGTYTYPMGPVEHYKASKTWNKLSPMASIAYTLPTEWLDGSWLNSGMGYLTYSEGFKSGTFVQFGPSLKTIEPETIKNWELGFKMDAFDHTARLNVAYFQMYYNNQQLIQVQTIPGGGFPVVTYANASKSEIDGVEFELSWAPIPRLLLTAGGNYNHYMYKNFKDKAFDIASMLNNTEYPTIDRSSERFPEVPDWTANVSAQYTFDTEIGTFTPRLQYNYISEVYMGLDAGAWRVKDQAVLPAYGLLNARVTYMSPDARWTASLYADNLNNKLYYQGTVATGDTLGEFTRQPSPPRMFGLEFGYRFGAL